MNKSCKPVPEGVLHPATKRSNPPALSRLYELGTKRRLGALRVFVFLGSLLLVQFGPLLLLDWEPLTTELRILGQSNRLAVPSQKEICHQALEYTESLLTGNHAATLGVAFLYKQGVVLGLPNTSLTLSISSSELVRIPIYQCGNCTGDCSVSFHARLVGEQAIRSARVVPSESNNSSSSSSVDYVVEFMTPPVAGNYQLMVEVKWWHGLADPGDSSHLFLGPPGRLNFEQNDNFRRGQQATVVSGSPILVQVEELVGTDTATSELVPICKSLNQEEGYWERVNRSSLCERNSSSDDTKTNPGECFVLDAVNPHWLWRGDDCRYEFLTPEQVSTCLKDTSIYIFGSSLTAEFYHNLVYYLRHFQHGRSTNTRQQQQQATSLLSKRVAWIKMEPLFGRAGQWFLPPTKQTFVVTDFMIPHLVWHESLRYLENVVVPQIQQEWSTVLQNRSRHHDDDEDQEKKQIHGIFYTSYPAHYQRNRFMSHERMVQANAIVGRAVTAQNNASEQQQGAFTIFDTTLPLDSRPDASWDGFHFLQTKENVGGASKMVTMMLLHHICRSGSTTSNIFAPT